MRCSNLSHAVSGLSVRSSQLTRSASVLPSCRACTHTPATAGANQRDLWMTWPSRGNHERATRVHAESSGETGTVPGICGAWTTSRTSGGAAGESETWSMPRRDRKSTRLNSSHGYISYAVFCLKKKKKKHRTHTLGIVRRTLQVV